MAKGSTVTLNELMGKAGDGAKGGIELHDLPNLLGEGMPRLEFTPLGRLRLIHALERRFGQGYRNLPGIKEVLSKFDQQAKITLEHHMILKRLGRRK